MRKQQCVQRKIGRWLKHQECERWCLEEAVTGGQACQVVGGFSLRCGPRSTLELLSSDMSPGMTGDSHTQCLLLLKTHTGQLALGA